MDSEYITSMDDYNKWIQQNNFIQAKYALEAYEQKLLYKIFEAVKQSDYKSKVITLDFQTLYTQYKNVIKKNITKKEFRMLIKNLQKKLVYITQNNKCICTQWYKVRGKLELPEITFILNEAVLKYIQALNKTLKDVKIETMYTFKSFYAMRLYELVKQWAGTHISLTYEIHVLKELLCVENNSSYNNFANFNKYVLEKAIREINEKSELIIQANQIKTGHTIKSVKFTIIQVEEQAEAIPDNKIAVHILENTINIKDFYIPAESRLEPRLKRLFYAQFKDYDFSDIDNYCILLQAEECTLLEDGKGIISALNYPLFSKILKEKLEQHTI